MTTIEHDVKVLNGLIATTIDSVDAYRAAAADAETDRFKSIFINRANEREDLVLEFQTRVRELGGEPGDDGSLLAGAQRFFMSLREAVASSSEDAIIAEVERAEDHIKAKYEKALTDADLTSETRNVIQQCFASVKDGHDQMRDLKHGIANAPNPER